MHHLTVKRFAVFLTVLLQMSSKKKDNEHWGYKKEWGIEGELHLKRPEDRQEDHRYDEKGDG